MQEQTSETPDIRKYAIFASTETIVRLIGYVVIISGNGKVFYTLIIIRNVKSVRRSEIQFNLKPVLRAICSHFPR